MCGQKIDAQRDPQPAALDRAKHDLVEEESGHFL
jgi:hypothetical protein